MTALVSICVIGVIFAIILLYVNRTAFYRLLGAGRAQVSKIGRLAIESDPIAVLQDRKDQAVESLGEAIKAQFEFRGLIKSIKRQVVEGQVEKSKLDAKIRSALNVRDEDRAAQFAVSMQREIEQLATNENQLGYLQSSYDNNMKRIKAVQNTVSNIDSEARRLKVELRFSKAEKDIGELMSRVQVGIDMGSVNEAKEEARRQIDQNRGAAAVRAELDSSITTEYEEAELDRQDRAKAILEEYKKSM